MNRGHYRLIIFSDITCHFGGSLFVGFSKIFCGQFYIIKPKCRLPGQHFGVCKNIYQKRIKGARGAISGKIDLLLKKNEAFVPFDFRTDERGCFNSDGFQKWFGDLQLKVKS